MSKDEILNINENLSSNLNKFDFIKENKEVNLKKEKISNFLNFNLFNKEVKYKN